MGNPGLYPLRISIFLNLLREVLCELGVSTGIELPLENVWGHVNFKATVNILRIYSVLIFYLRRTNCLIIHICVQKSSECITKLVNSNIYIDSQKAVEFGDDIKKIKCI